MSSRLTPSDSARRKRTSRNSSRQTASCALRLGYSARCAPRPLRHRRVSRPLCSSLALRKVKSLNDEAARLQVGLAGAGLDRDQLAVDHVQDHAVEIGQLLPVGVDPVIVRIALGDEANGRWPGPHHPRLQGRQVRIVEPVHAIAPPVQLRPVARLVLLDLAGELSRIGIRLVELPQIVGGPVDEQRAGTGQRRQEVGVRRGPAVADRERVDDLHLRQLAVDHQLPGRPERAELLVVGDVLPKVTEILGRERRAVRPAMALAQPQREDPAVLDLDRAQDVGHELQLAVVADQARIAVHHQKPRVLAVRG